VRVITRLDETCREVRDAARVIGDAELFKKMEESQIKIKRDSEFLLPFLFVFFTVPSRFRCKPVFLSTIFTCIKYDITKHDHLHELPCDSHSVTDTSSLPPSSRHTLKKPCLAEAAPRPIHSPYHPLLIRLKPPRSANANLLKAAIFRH
jgi:hypothetical protein